MNQLVLKTLGGISKKYYIRQFLFGLLFPALFYLMSGTENFIAILSLLPKAWLIFFIVLFIINTFLYPYSRFIYEKTISYVVGENVFFVNAFFMLLVKFFTMAICWSWAIFIAPIGLLYLYFYHSQNNH